MAGSASCDGVGPIGVCIWPGGDFEHDEPEHEVGIEDMPHDADGLVEP
jgi:hypothetical protein